MTVACTNPSANTDQPSGATDNLLTDGSPIECEDNVYNCPDAPSDALSSCEDVDRVWITCSGDPHELIEDINDAVACATSCD